MKEFVYEGIGSFESIHDQIQIQVDTNDKRLIKGQYYVTMVNQSEDETSYYKIFVDENTHTFTLADRSVIETSGEKKIFYYNDSTILFATQENETIVVQYDLQDELVTEYVIDIEDDSLNKIKMIQEETRYK